MRDKAFLTIDSGGSKTKLSLYDMGGDLVCCSTAKGFGLAVDCDDILNEALPILFDFCKGYCISVVICNLGGKNKKQMELTLKKAFCEAKVIVFRESEGVVGVELCKKYSAQVTLMAGTGTIAIAPHNDKVVISGGWGANISDKGSGYQLGLDAVRLALEEIDGTDELSLLTKAITGIHAPPSTMSAEDYCIFRDNVRNNLSPFDRAHIASLAKAVYACAKQGDKVSTGLYEKVGIDLADIVIATSRKAGLGLICVVVNGGMVNAREFWQASFEEKLKKECGTETMHYLTDGIDEVMCDIAKKILKGEEKCFQKD